VKVTLRNEVNLNVDMSRLMDECIDRLNWQERRKERGYMGDYDTLEELVADSIEFIYDVDIYYYDNGLEVREVITKNLLVWCAENDYTEEHTRLSELG
jgi:hypothetical protein